MNNVAKIKGGHRDVIKNIWLPGVHIWWYCYIWKGRVAVDGKCGRRPTNWDRTSYAHLVYKVHWREVIIQNLTIYLPRT
ncbi:hypothetical protein MYX07_01590 [Patescibacteria group bacterium AH-259-L07]|nr:hypothetical protein [Patescibacteria group bacterium AH-259-L07]